MAYSWFHVMDKAALAQKSNHMLAIGATFMDFAGRTVGGRAIVALARRHYRANKRWFHGVKNVVIHASVLSTPQRAKCRLIGSDPCFTEGQQFLGANGLFPAIVTYALGAVTKGGGWSL
jgi:hypothetical protein